MKPQPWFERALKVIDDKLFLIPHPDKGEFLLARKNGAAKAGYNALWFIPFNRQDQITLDSVRMADAWEDDRHRKHWDAIARERREPLLRQDAERRAMLAQYQHDISYATYRHRSRGSGRPDGAGYKNYAHGLKKELGVGESDN